MIDRKESKVIWTQPVALAVLIVLIALMSCTGHAIVTHLLRTKLERRKVRELKRYNDRQDAEDRERSVQSRRHHPSSPGPVFTRVAPTVSPLFATRYPAPPQAAHATEVRRRLEDQDVATVIDIEAYQS